MGHQVSITSEEFGALITLGQLDGSAFRLPQDLLVRLQSLLLDLSVSFDAYQELLLRSDLILKLSTTGFLEGLLPEGGRELEFTLRLEE